MNTTSKICSKCSEEKVLELFYKQPEGRLGRAAHCKACHQKGKAERQTNRRWEVKKKYGITLEDYDRMETEQLGGCAICKQPDPAGRRLAVDHCHYLGHVRGLLCFHCNVALGNLKHDVELLKSAIAYLEKT
jgi:hypothetical protein